MNDGFPWAIGLMIGLLLIGVPMFINYGNHEKCKRIAELMDTPYDYSFLTKCNIKYQGQWVPLSNIRKM